MIDSDISCPGCGVLLTENNCGGYRAYCETCVEKIPELPKSPAGTGFVLQGNYPDFYWRVSADSKRFSNWVYDEDIPQ